MMSYIYVPSEKMKKLREEIKAKQESQVETRRRTT